MSNLLDKRTNQSTNIEVHCEFTSHSGDREKPKNIGHGLILQVWKNWPEASSKKKQCHRMIKHSQEKKKKNSGPRTKLLGF